MKHNFKIVTCIAILLFQVSLSAQNKPFKQVVEELDSLWTLYASIHPRDGIVALKDVGVTYQTLLEEYAGPEEPELSPDKDSTDVFTLQYYFEQKVRHKFREVMYHPDLKKHDLAQMIPGVLMSDDKKFYSLSIDENTGGSYHSRITMYHYTGVPETDKTAFEGFASDGYYEIFTLKTKQGTKYLLIGNVITCNTCMATYALLTHFANGKFVKDFETVLEGRFSGDITYNPEKKVLSASYQTSDLMKECSCSIGEEQITLSPIAGMETDIQDCSCTYKFDGSTFKLTSQQQSWAGKE